MAERGMGRGLAAILSVSTPEAGETGAAELRELSVDLLKPNRSQPRRRFDDAALQALAESVEERGVLQPVLVRPRAGGTFEIVAGERRWRAAKLAGLDQVPALVQDRDDATTLEVALVENMAREDLNPVEEARAVAALVEELNLTREAVGRKVGRSRVAISNLLRILDLPDETLALLESGALTEGHGKALLLAEDHADRKRLGRAAVDGDWSVRVTEERARQANAAASAPGARTAAAVHPDQAAAAAEIADALGGALGTEVKVRPRGTGYKVELAVGSLDDALALARRVRNGA
ncbi:MAG: ParB family transcriptional regulator, chromosome partitioning protein [Baekduia sp.]|nr:ParB/RepB/Spo0J family partition protein [Conexibacter sp.]MDX6714788.1 ParB family transcriptional regulator, chromosome partitioning protein [Baekduia sp.]